MSVKIDKLEGWRRGVEKGVSRDLDTHMISEGARSTLETALNNDMFASLNLNGFVISHIGGRSIGVRVDD